MKKDQKSVFLFTGNGEKDDRAIRFLVEEKVPFVYLSKSEKNKPELRKV